MKKYKILNLYACLGGNRYKWDEVAQESGIEIEVTAVERYPDMSLYEEIIFLKTFFKGKFCIENVVPYYEPLIHAQKRGRHLYWTNFIIPNVLSDREPPKITANKARKSNSHNLMCEFHEIDVSIYKGEQDKSKIARNLVDYEAGRTIFKTALGIVIDNNKEQLKMF